VQRLPCAVPLHDEGRGSGGVADLLLEGAPVGDGVPVERDDLVAGPQARGLGRGVLGAGRALVGLGGAEITQSETEPTEVVWVLMPKPISTLMKITTARIRFMNGPANITMTRFQGLRV